MLIQQIKDLREKEDEFEQQLEQERADVEN